MQNAKTTYSHVIDTCGNALIKVPINKCENKSISIHKVKYRMIF